MNSLRCKEFVICVYIEMHFWNVVYQEDKNVYVLDYRYGLFV